MAKKLSKKALLKRRRRRKRIITAIVIFMIILLACAAGLWYMSDARVMTDRSDPVATVLMKDGGKLVIELFPKNAPESVGAFIALANEGYYDGLAFEASSPLLLVEGGALPYTVKGEFADNGIVNPVSHSRGAIGLSRRTAYDSAEGGFYLLTEDAPYLNGSNAAFGKVIKGMEYADKIADGALSPVIGSIRVNTKGIVYEYEKIQREY